MLAAGVFWSGFIKDMVCLPRPLSPPLYRITMSGSAALEYGFPSSHSTNAVSVAVYGIQMLRNASEPHSNINTALQCLAYFYAVSIVFGRLYCGMHGFLDVIVGSILGAVIAVFQLMYGDWFDFWITDGKLSNPLIALLIILVLIRIHPEPADDCPCFDDSVAFSGVVIGCQIGAWHYAQTSLSLDSPIPSTVPFDFISVGLLKATIRIILGVVIIFVWRASMKPALFKILPPIFRVLEHARLNLPRAFFLDASYVMHCSLSLLSLTLFRKYTSIPHLRGDDNVIPPASELPHMLNNLVHPRKRSVSVGPQSAADAYETLAYRNRRRRESINSMDGLAEESTWSSTDSLKKPEHTPLLGATLLPTPAASRVQSYEHMMGTGTVPSGLITPPKEVDYDSLQTPGEAEKEKRELFMNLMKPRVRYDVEVVTKLIVYGGKTTLLLYITPHLIFSGIAWLAVEGNPILFELVGLGMGVHAVR
jgi:hypothetical protein